MLPIQAHIWLVHCPLDNKFLFGLGNGNRAISSFCFISRPAEVNKAIQHCMVYVLMDTRYAYVLLDVICLTNDLQTLEQ